MEDTDNDVNLEDMDAEDIEVLFRRVVAHLFGHRYTISEIEELMEAGFEDYAHEAEDENV